MISPKFSEFKRKPTQAELERASLQRKLAIIRVLVGLAWADGTLADAEIDAIHSFAYKIGISDEYTAELKEAFAQPLSAEENNLLLQDLISETLSRKERHMLIEAMEQVARAEASINEAERTFIDSIKKALRYKNLPHRMARLLKTR